MLLTLSATHQPATDLGFLLHENPDNVQELDVSFGRVVIFYPEASEDKCTFVLALASEPVDPRL